MPPLDTVIPGSIGLLLTGGAAVWATRLLVLALSARGWTQSSGTVLSSYVQERRQRYGSYGRVRIKYQFDALGRTHSGTRVFFGDAMEGNYAVCQDLVAKYSVGAQVIVFHRPEDPAMCCLEPRADMRAWLLAPFAWVMAGVILKALLFGEP